MLDEAMKVSLTLVAFDKMSKVIRDAVQKSNDDFNKMQEKIKDTSERLEKFGKTASLVGGALVGFGAVNLKMAADFEAGMSNVSTLIDTNIENFGAMKDEVLEIAKRTPVALEGLTSALYDIRSAGISADMQFKVLERSAQLGLTGLGSTSEAVDLVTSSLNAFQLKGEKADKVYDTIFKTVKYGKTTISGIAQGFGSVAGTVAAAGIELDDYLAAVAALTTTGQPAAQAHHQLKAAIAGMTRESEDSAKVFNSLGVKSFKELIQKSGGMVNAFKAITNKVNGNDSAILGLFGSTMAYNAVLGLTTKQSQSYIDTLQSMRYGVSLIDEGYQKQYNTEHARLQRMKNLTQTIGIELGEALSPLFGKLLDLTEYGINLFGKLSPQAKSFFAISLVGFGAIASTIGVASLMGSKLLGFYGDFLNNARKLTPVLIQNSANLLKFFGLTSTAQTFTLGALFSDIKRIDTELRYGIVNSFKTLPTKIAESTVALKNWVVTSAKAVPSMFINGLNNLKTAFLNIPNLIKNAIVSFRAFSLTLLTSPIGWIALAIGAAALLIYKYWKPISGFFKGMWQGLVEGLQPVLPIFKRMGEALSPLFAPIKSLINWFKQIIKPVDDVGGAAENMGVRFGKAIASIILKVTQFVSKIFECGLKIPTMIANGIMAGVGKVSDAIKKVTQTIRDFLPHSPAKTGPLKDLNKVKIIETVAQTIKPAPIVSAMNKTLGVFNTGFKANVPNSNFVTQNHSAPVTIHYNPIITLSGTASKEDFAQMLKQHKDEILRIFKQENERRLRMAY